MTISQLTREDTILSDRTLSGELSLAVVRLARRLRGRRASKVVSLTQLSALHTLHHERSIAGFR